MVFSKFGSFTELFCRITTALIFMGGLTACTQGGSGSAFVLGSPNGPNGTLSAPSSNPSASPSTNPSASPTPSPSGTNTSSMGVGVGGYHACSIKNGGLKCWGDNQEGTLGNNSVTNSDSPVDVTGLGPNSGVSYVPRLGTYSACAIVSGGVKCWGDNNYGESGNGGTSSNQTFPCAGTSNYTFSNGSVANTVPVWVSGLGAGANVTDLAVSTVYSACAVANGAVQCWGENLYGELGTGNKQCSTSPVTAIGSGATSVAVGSYFTCAVVNGGVQCWGQNSNGQLGDGNTSDSLSPVNVSGLGAGSGIVKVAAAENSACALRNDGAVFCWGQNTKGQLGDGSNNDRSSPVQVSGLSGASSITVGSASACAIKSDGSAVCWGDNTYGQLGTNNTNSSSVPVAVTNLGAGSNTTSISIDFSSACAVANGHTYCWGSNFSGSLGTGNMTKYFTPTLVQGF